MDTDRSCVYKVARPNSLERILTLEETTDVTLVGVDGKIPLRAHKAVLASASDFFMRLFFGEGCENWEENAKGVVSFKEFSSDTLHRIVDIAYIGRISLSPTQDCQSLLELLCASDFFDMPELKEVCDHFLRRRGREIVQEEFQNFTLPVLRKVLASDALGCEEITIFKAVEKWMETNKTSLGEDDIKEILGMVRYGLIPAKELVSVVGVSKWKDEALFLAALDNWIEPNITKLKVPQYLARANTFPLLPLVPGAFCIEFNEGVYLYQVDLLPRSKVPKEGHPYAGVLLAVDNLEMPITLSSQLRSLSFSFSAFPEESEQTIAFSPAKYLHRTHGVTNTATRELQMDTPIVVRPRSVQIGMRQSSPSEGSSSFSNDGMQGKGKSSKFRIYKDEDAVVIAQDKQGGRTIVYDLHSSTKYVLIGLKVDGPVTLKQVQRS